MAKRLRAGWSFPSQPPRPRGSATCPPPTSRTSGFSVPTSPSLALGTLKSNSRLNFSARVLLMLFALAASTLAVVYVFIRADEMVQVLTDPARNA